MERIVLILDRLNTHTPASLYAAFPPADAQRLSDRLEIHHTPKHCSRLNMAELELSILQRQCLGQRFRNRETMSWAVVTSKHSMSCSVAGTAWLKGRTRSTAVISNRLKRLMSRWTSSDRRVGWYRHRHRGQ